MTATTEVPESTRIIRRMAADVKRDRDAKPGDYAIAMLTVLAKYEETRAEAAGDVFFHETVIEYSGSSEFDEVRHSQRLRLPRRSDLDENPYDPVISAMRTLFEHRGDLYTSTHIPESHMPLNGIDESHVLGDLIVELDDAGASEHILGAVLLMKMRQLELDAIRQIGNEAYELIMDEDSNRPVIDSNWLRERLVGDDGIAAKLGRADNYSRAIDAELAVVFPEFESDFSGIESSDPQQSRAGIARKIISGLVFMKVGQVRKGGGFARDRKQLRHIRSSLVEAIGRVEPGAAGSLGEIDFQAKNLIDEWPDLFTRAALEQIRVTGEEREMFEELGGPTRARGMQHRRQRQSRVSSAVRKEREARAELHRLEGTVYGVRGNPSQLLWLASCDSRYLNNNRNGSDRPNVTRGKWFMVRLKVVDDNGNRVVKRMSDSMINSPESMLGSIKKRTREGELIDLGKSNFAEADRPHSAFIDDLLSADGYNKWIGNAPADPSMPDPRPAPQMVLGLGL